MDDVLSMAAVAAFIGLVMICHSHEVRHGCDLGLDIVGSSLVVLHEGVE